MSVIVSFALLMQLLARSVVLGCGQDTAPTVHFPAGMNLGVHVYTDVNHTRHFNTSQQARQYVLSFFKSVFLRFWSAHQNLKLHLVNITLLNDTSVENDCFNYGFHQYTAFRQTRYTKYINLDTSLEKFKKCVKNESSPAYLKDVAPLIFVLTAYETRKSIGGVMRRTPGRALTQGGICTENNLAIGPDIPGSYIGVLSTVRLLAYLMGSQYDGERFGANANNINCQRGSKYVMSFYENEHTSNLFSPCSLVEMQSALGYSEKNACQNMAKRTDLIKLSTPFPGERISQNEQCKAIHWDYYHKNNPEECLTGCQYYAGGRTITGSTDRYPMLDGMTCHSGSKCYNGICRADKPVF
ncbi:uncharacterized protein LOC135386325 [Ornithodoros turicata]|uniref:uncharacterized protein LOC135386325 n=1 Tax=Ornithodoros turicata TaxID=34597 RepID=UPI003139E9C6